MIFRQLLDPETSTYTCLLADAETREAVLIDPVLEQAERDRVLLDELCREHGMAFTGDALLIRGCGRTDFQEGDAATLFHSVRNRIFSLPVETLLYPGHDYKGRTVTTVAEEQRFNARLGLARSLEDFLATMRGLKLAHPKQMERAVPANLLSGVPTVVESGREGKELEPATRPVARAMEELGRQDAELWQGTGI